MARDEWSETWDGGTVQLRLTVWWSVSDTCGSRAFRISSDLEEVEQSYVKLNLSEVLPGVGWFVRRCRSAPPSVRHIRPLRGLTDICPHQEWRGGEIVNRPLSIVNYFRTFAPSIHHINR